MEKEIQNYRGVKLATIVQVKEGEGTPESPAKITDYVIVFKNVDGVLRQVTLGKVVSLTEQERLWFDEEDF